MSNPFKQLIAWLGAEFEDRVSPRQAMQLPPFWFGVNKITGHCARLPLFVKRQLKTGGQAKAEGHWAYQKLLTQPNGYQTVDTFKQQLTGHAILWGNGRAAVINPGSMDAEIIPLMPDRTETVMIRGKKYHVTKPEKTDRLPLFLSIEKDREGTIVLADSEVIHLQGFGFDGITGMSLVAQMRRTLGIPTEQESHAYNQTKKGFVAKMMVEAPAGMLTKEADAKEWIEQFNKMHSSAENSGKAGLLRNGMKATVLSMSNDDAQFLEQRRFSRQDIALMLGLDGMPGDGDSHSYNSKEMESLNYLDTGLAPWACKWEMQIDTKVLTERERRQGYFSMFDFAELLRTDAKTQAEIHSIRIASRVYNPNKCREELGENPYEGGEEYINPSISQAGQQEPPTEDDSKAKAIVGASLKRLIRREAKDAISGANKSDFCAWLDTYYDGWKAKLTELTEELDIEPELIANHCDESKEMLLTVAGESKTTEELIANVKKCVENWENRADLLISKGV